MVLTKEQLQRENILLCGETRLDEQVQASIKQRKSSDWERFKQGS